MLPVRESSAVFKNAAVDRQICVYFTFVNFIHIPQQQHTDTRPAAQETGEHVSLGQGAEPVKHFLLLVRKKRRCTFKLPGEFSYWENMHVFAGLINMQEQ